MPTRRPQSQVTIKDIASDLGLAHSTVSRALNDHPQINDATKTRVRAAARRLGYVANSGARLLRAGASQVVGLIVPDIENEFYSTAAKVMSGYCAEQGYQLILAVSEDDPGREATQVLAMQEARVAGVLITPTSRPQLGVAKILRRLAAVQFLRQNKGISGHFVGADDTEGIALATDHLLQLGHRRLAYIGGPDALSTGQQRAQGFRQAHAARGLAADAALIRQGNLRPPFGREALADLLAQESPPSGLVVAGSRQVIGVFDEINERGLRIPEALAIVAYSDTEWFRLSRPSVTAVALPVAEMAATAAALLFRLIRDPDADAPGSCVTFSPRLLNRESSGHTRVAAQPTRA